LLVLSGSRYVHHRHLHSFPTRRSSDLIKLCFQAFQSAQIAHVTQIRMGSRKKGNEAVDVDLESTLDRTDNFPRHPLVLFKRVLRSEEHTSELQSRENLVCRLLLEKKKY